MAVDAEAASMVRPSRSNTTELAIVGGAIGVAVLAALASQMGVPQAQPLVGAVLILGIAYTCSTNRQAIDMRTVAWGLLLQIVFALIVLKTAIGQQVFAALGNWITRLLGFSFVGASFVFGPLGDSVQWRTVTQALGPAASGLPVAFQVAPTIIFVAALFAILYYFGVMQIIVRLFALLMHRVMRASGAESLNVAAGIFMGQT